MKYLDTNRKLRDCKSISPDPKFPGFMKIEFSSKIRKGYQHSEWYPTEEFAKNNPELMPLISGSARMVEESFGVVSAAGKDFLKDKTQNWKVDIYKGFTVWISRGKGEGQTRQVESNTKNLAQIKKVWEVIPDKSSQYVISKNVHDPQVFGNSLPEIENNAKIGRGSN